MLACMVQVGQCLHHARGHYLSLPSMVSIQLSPLVATMQALPKSIEAQGSKWRMEVKKNKNNRLIIIKKDKKQVLQLATTYVQCWQFMWDLLNKIENAEVVEEELTTEKANFVAVCNLVFLYPFMSTPIYVSHACQTSVNREEQLSKGRSSHMPTIYILFMFLQMQSQYHYCFMSVAPA